MKKLLFAITLLSFSLVSEAQFSSANLTAAGLTCAMCTKAIYSSLNKIPVVESVGTDIKNSSFLITFKKGATVDPDLIKTAVENAGFSVAGLQLTGSFDHVQVKNDAHILIDGKTFHFLNAPAKELNGIQTLTMVDKNYLTRKEFNKFNTPHHHPCVETGKAEECCVKMGIAHSSRIYHVTL